MIKVLPPGIHIILGDSAAGIFTRVFHAQDKLLVDQDVLSCGPTPPCEDLAVWSKLRAEYWNTLAAGASEEHVPSAFNLVVNALRLKDSVRINIWAATGLSEQLFIAFVVHLVDLIKADPARIYLVPFEVSGKKRVIGMGELDEAQMRAHPEPVPLSENVAKDYRDAWSVLTMGEPAMFEKFVAMHPQANRWLIRAIRLMARRFPDRRSGLTYWDSALLARVKPHGPAASRIIGYTMAETFDDGDLVGDWYLFGRLLKLGDVKLPKPLIKLSGDKVNMGNTDAVLTPFGIEVAAERASNYPANPIEDWAAGVKLSSAERSLWFNERGKLVKC